MSLLHLPDEIQEYVIALPPWEQRLYSGRRLREIAVLSSQRTQLAAVAELSGTADESWPLLEQGGTVIVGSCQCMRLSLRLFPSVPPSVEYVSSLARRYGMRYHRIDRKKRSFAQIHLEKIAKTAAPEGEAHSMCSVLSANATTAKPATVASMPPGGP